MYIYALIIEAHSDDDRLIGLYSSIESARAAYAAWEDHSLFPFYRIERRAVDASADEYSPDYVVDEHYVVDEDY
jgi:hypothetical protein